MGKEAREVLGIPYVCGAHPVKKWFEIVEKHPKLVVSRVFDEDVSLPDLRAVIKYDFLGGSRRQEAQRVSRLLHRVYEGTEYHIVMILRSSNGTVIGSKASTRGAST